MMSWRTGSTPDSSSTSRLISIEIAEAYAAMDERRAVKSLIRVGNVA